MGLSDPIARRVVLKAPVSTGASQSGSQSPSAVGHYANQIGANTSPSVGSAPRQRLRRGRDSVPTAARGKKPTRTAG